MNMALWIVQGLLALLFAATGMIKLAGSEKRLSERMPWTKDYPAMGVRVAGLLEVAAALGVVLPAWVDVDPLITPIAAFAMILLMLAEAGAHFRRREYSLIGVNLMVTALAVFVAYSRWLLLPLP